MTDNLDNSGNFADDMAEYLQTFLDETEEQLDDLVETMLALERNPTNAHDLNEAFRLIHSIKGSAGMMGFDNITVLTHHLENRFERFRSGLAQLDEPTMNLVLRCIDFLRQCNSRLRDGKLLGSSAGLLEELRRIEEQAATPKVDEPRIVADDEPESDADGTDSQSSRSLDEPDGTVALTRMVVRFRAGLQLVDLKAQLIVSRLSGLGDVKSTQPDVDQLTGAEHLDHFEVRIDTLQDLDSLRAAADVDGVESIEFIGNSAQSVTEIEIEAESDAEVVTDEPSNPQSDIAAKSESTATDSELIRSPPPPSSGEGAGVGVSGVTDRLSDTSSPESLEPTEASIDAALPLPEVDRTEPAPVPFQPTATSAPSAAEKTTTKVAETMRVDIDRLDTLMNLAGELAINRARLMQVSGQISPALRKASMLNRVREFSDNLRRTIEGMENVEDASGDWSAQIQHLRAGLEMMDEQSEIWHNGRHCLNQIGEAIDQLSRVSHSLQRGVLETRMVPVGPLFNRFKRVVRDLSKERGKVVNLLIRGEKTELDKRMIDELGDPLVHLVRNSIDHGLEPPDVRVSSGKSETGTILLEASHSGNNVYIHVRDDGQGIDVEKIKLKLIDKGILSASAADELSNEQSLDYIWHPGFSTADAVTDVSGRGVGMDVVKTRIQELNGTIEIDSTPQQGTAFTIRLPLTLAIINSLLVRMRNVVFSMPIDDVREIVSVMEPDVVAVQGKQTIDVRGEFIPLVGIDDVLQWHATTDDNARAENTRHANAAMDRRAADVRTELNGSPESGRETRSAASTSSGAVNRKTVEVVILHVGGKAMGLRVDELLGSQDIVIKSLSDNFMHISGLSGASILGDGSVCLTLDVGTIINMATRPSHFVDTAEASN